MVNSNNKRIARNTLYLYLRMGVITIINLYVVRVVLRELGAEDYGIYYVVSGVTTLFSFVSTSLSSGAQRFFAFDIGKGEIEKLKITFSITFYIYLTIGVVCLILLETIGVWFLNSKLQIPENQKYIANIVFQITIISFLGYIIQIPFNAAVIAYERMSFFAYLSIVEAIMKLAIALLLIFMVANKLILYSILLCLTSYIILSVYIFYTRKYLRGFRIIKVKEFGVGKDLLKYSGWSMLGVLALLGRNQGLIILLNMFFTPIVSAAQAIAQQIYGTLNQLIANVFIASRPQITKYCSINEMEKMWQLIFFSGKIAFFLLILISVPLMICMNFILKIWLVNVPKYTTFICLCLLFSLIIETFTNQLVGGFQALNKLKKLQSICSSILLLTLPISYIFLRFKQSVMIPYMVLIVLSGIYAGSIILVARLELGMSVKVFVKKLFLPAFLVLVISPIAPYLVHSLISEGWTNFIVTLSFSIVSTILSIWLCGLNDIEKEKIREFIKKKISII